MKKKSDKADSWAERARLMMEKRGFTYDDLGSALEVGSRSAVGHYLAGRRALSADQAVALAQRLGCRVGWLLTGELPVEYGESEEAITNSQSPQHLVARLSVLPPQLYSAVADLISAMTWKEAAGKVARKKKTNK